MVEYAGRKEDPLINIVRTHQHLKTEVQKGIRQIKDSITETTKERWQGKRRHEQLPCNLDDKLVDINSHIDG